MGRTVGFLVLVVNLVWSMCVVDLAYSLEYEKIKDLYKKSFEFERENKIKDAIKVLMPIYKAYPQGYTINLRLGWLYYLMKKYSNSEYHYKKALEAIPNSIEAMLGLSLPYLAQERWKDVEQLMYRVLEIDYYNYYGNLRLCISLQKQKKFEVLEVVARKMLAIYPTDMNFLIQLGISLYYQGKFSSAKAVFQDILVLYPKSVIAKNYLKWLRKKLIK